MKSIFSLLLLCVFTLSCGCGISRKSELTRIRKQKEAAARYDAENWTERRNIARDIVRYYGKDRNDLVLEILTVAASDPHPSVRIEVVQGFAKIHSAPSLSMITKAALEDVNDNVRWYALQALRSLSDPSSADTYARCLGSGDWLIREEAIKGICALDDAVIREKLVPSIIKAINDPNAAVMLAALRGVKIKDERIYTAIAEKLRSATEYNYSQIEASLAALNGYRLDPKTKEKVIGLLVHNNQQIRILALRVLKKDRILTKSQ
ncbi:MAG: HEAT repeat domain-containing protein [Spirochaetes bacterium]|nr:HEAT repeat domain-containing protein [Spirochaetota bacterium]